MFSFSDGARQPAHDHEVNLVILHLQVGRLSGEKKLLVESKPSLSELECEFFLFLMQVLKS